MVSGTYLFFKLSNQTGQGVREQIMRNDTGLNREGLRVTNTAEERESLETEKETKQAWLDDSLFAGLLLCVCQDSQQ